MSRRGYSGSRVEDEADAALAARLAKLTGASDSAPTSSSRANSSFDFDDRPRSESDLIEEILSQAMDASVLEQKYEEDSDRSLVERLARLKAHGAVPSATKAASPSPSEPAPQPPAVVRQPPIKVNPLDELEWISSDDENDEEVLDRVVQMALAYPDSEDDK